jgi:carotenoid cleavage dioxygenase-like enzyme
MDRREFCLNSLSLGASLGLPLSHWDLNLNTAAGRLSYEAHQNLEVLGPWQPRLIVGQIPEDLQGNLFRFGPGKKHTFGQNLTHFFDGDGFVTRFDFSAGKISALSEFVETSARQHEARDKKMLYLEFGTKPQGKIRGLKNSPNINGIIWQDELLVLSESTAPYAVDPVTFKTLRFERFQESLPKNLGFSAHSRIDPQSGDLISFGLTQELNPKLVMYRVLKKLNRVQEIHSVKLGGFYPVHDVALSPDYMVFLIPPVKVNLMGAALGNKPIAELLKVDEKNSLQLLVTPLSGRASPFFINTGLKSMNFHHIKSWQEGNFLFLDSFIIEDASIYETFKTWSREVPSPSPHSSLKRFKIDLNLKKLVDLYDISPPHKSDFPLLLSDDQFISIAVSPTCLDPLGFNQILLWDQNSGEILKTLELPSGEILSEVVPCGNYLVHLGYSLNQKESFLDVRSSETLNLLSRVWLGHSHPIGFHGFFTNT